MSRGYLCAIWRPTWRRGTWGSIRSRAEWMECAHRSLATFRLFHPVAPLVLVDVDDMLTREEKDVVLNCGADILRGESLSRDWVTTGTLWNKVVALKFSPFRETILYDLDFHFTGSIASAFDIAAPLGALHYPKNPRTQNRVNTGLTVCLDKAAISYWEKHRLPDGLRLRRGSDRDCDEMAMDRAISAGVGVTLLPDTYGRNCMEWCAKWGKGTGWRADLERTHAMAFHWQGLKKEMAADADLARLLNAGSYLVPDKVE
jgi:hypothetical protein